MQVGQKVRWLDADLRGTVSSILPDGRVNVLDSDGMLWPALSPRQLVVIGKAKASILPVAAPPSSPKENKEEESLTQPVVASGERVRCPSIALSVSDPSHVLDNGITLWAINPSGLHMYLVVSVDDGDEHQLIWNGEVGANTTKYLRRFTGQDHGFLNELRAQALFFHPLGFAPVDPVRITVRLGGTRLMKPGVYSAVAGLAEPAMVFALEHEPPKPMSSKSFAAPREARKRADTLAALTKHEPRVDLHLEKIPGDHSRLTDHEKLTLQLRLCQQSLDAAIRDHLPSIIFIHGKGKGRLREEVLNLAALHGFNCVLLPNAGETRVYLI